MNRPCSIAARFAGSTLALAAALASLLMSCQAPPPAPPRSPGEKWHVPPQAPMLRPPQVVVALPWIKVDVGAKAGDEETARLESRACTGRLLAASMAVLGDAVLLADATPPAADVVVRVRCRSMQPPASVSLRIEDATGTLHWEAWGQDFAPEALMATLQGVLSRLSLDPIAIGAHRARAYAHAHSPNVTPSGPPSAEAIRQANLGALLERRRVHAACNAEWLMTQGEREDALSVWTKAIETATRSGGFVNASSFRPLVTVATACDPNVAGGVQAALRELAARCQVEVGKRVLAAWQDPRLTSTNRADR